MNLRLKGAGMFWLQANAEHMCCSALLCQGRAVAPPPSLGPPFHPFAHTLKHKKRGRSQNGNVIAKVNISTGEALAFSPTTIRNRLYLEALDVTSARRRRMYLPI